MMPLAPTALAHYLDCFRVDPTQGQLFVPVLEVSQASPFGMVTSQPLDFDNMGLFSRLASSYIQQRLEDPAGSGDNDWALHQLGPSTTLFVNSQEGRSVTMDSKGDICRMINGARRGLAVEVAFYNEFCRVSLGQGMDLHGQDFRPHALYTMEFGGSGIMGLRRFLGLSRETPVTAVALALYNRLDLSDAPSLTSDELSSLEKDRHSRVTINGGFDQPLLGAWGVFSETLKIFVKPTDFLNSTLSPRLLPIWDLAVSLMQVDNPSIKPLQNFRPLN